MARIGSDHRPLFIKNLYANHNYIKYFRFLNYWLNLTGFYDVVKESWNSEVSGNSMWILQSKLKALSRKLTQWSKEDIGDINEAVNNWEVKLQYLEDKDIENNIEESREEMNRAHVEYIRWLNVQDSLLKQNSRIKWFEDGDKNTRRDEKNSNAAIKHFNAQFNLPTPHLNPSILEYIPKYIMEQDNLILCRILDDEEIKNAVLTLSVDSTAGPDGYNGVFFHNCWDIIRKDVCAFVMEVFKGKVSPNQSDFVKDRLIYENILYLKRLFIISLTRIKKIDMVQNLISNVWYSIIINKSRHGFFSSSQGLKQGDPLSPSLFIIVDEVLSRSLNSLYNYPDFTPFDMYNKVPKVNHLAYVDNIIIFCSGNSKSIKLVMKQIGNYEDSSDQLVNTDKSFFLTAPKIFSNKINKIRK
ncbi:uncharacterized protein LOC142170355 [Nicotiana tabacum]|uniref:Uncharacterized protein LOC142170355 n=1 Tax=Nicotiana tabacum TaxID=4097 RepID=A0AC58STR4_TOBAC